MERRSFIKTCCLTSAGIALGAGFMQSCGSIYYATASREKNRLVLPKSEFLQIKKEKEVARKFVLIKTPGIDFPICLYKTGPEAYTASLLKCTHRGCELNVGGGIYSCPCHGSEFTTTGKLLEGPAERDLQTFKTEEDHENIYIYLA